jgi:3-deoxy-D-manno-octulosonate 8-phosphate phosphatase (KDO 8-P phosphatase)
MKFKLFITDIDGVWTDGGMYYASDGTEYKKFNTSDSAGVLFLKLLHIPVAIITGEENTIVKKRAEKLKVDFLFMGAKNKLKIANALCESLQIKLSEAAYIGDDINDIELLKNVGLSAAPSNAPDYIKNIVHWTMSLKGGEGVFREFVEKVLKEQNLLESVIEKYISNHQKLQP